MASLTSVLTSYSQMTTVPEDPSAYASYRPLMKHTGTFLSSDHQRLEPAVNSCHRPPDSSGIQGSPCQPVSTTPDAQLIPMLHVHSFILGTWVILSDFIGHRSFIQGNLQSEEDYYPYLGRRRRRTAHSYFRKDFHTLLAVNIGHAWPPHRALGHS